jgi:hypothetical protein
MKINSRRAWLGVVLLVGAAGASGCDRTYLTRTHGRAYSEAFGQQRVYPDGAPHTAKGVEGLDSQEASVIAGSYRRSLAKEGSPEGGAAPLVMANPAFNGMAQPNLPPPSVPNGQ